MSKEDVIVIATDGMWDVVTNKVRLKVEVIKYKFTMPIVEVIKKSLKSRVSIRKTFAQFMRNETQNFSFFAHHFCAKKQQFAQSFAKVISRKIALFRFRETQVLRNSATRVLRNFVKIKRLVTVCVS